MLPPLYYSGMEILLASPRGFCAGVRYAMGIVDAAWELYGQTHQLFILKEIVHNQRIVREYNAQGIQSVASIQEVPAGSILIFSAHGVPPDFHEQAKDRGLFVLDATCPLVRKVHLEAIRFAAQGYHILYIGHEGHDEAIGVLAECPEHITLVNDLAEAQTIQPPQTDRLVYLTQTTLSLSETDSIIKCLQERFPGLAAPPKEDICYATTNRQQAVQELAPQVQLMLVIGSQNSSNSQRLRELSEQLGTTAHLIDSPAEIDSQWLVAVEQIGLTSGASAPEALIEETIEWLKRYAPESTVREVAVVKEQTVFPLPKLTLSS